MASAEDEVRSVLSQIEGLTFPYPLVPLLSEFVHEALHPPSAAHYVRDRLAAGESVSLVADWILIIESITTNGNPLPPLDDATQQAITRRDGGRCCITGKKGTSYDPLVVCPILPVPSGWVTNKPGIIHMLGAFFGPSYRDWWLSYAQNPDQRYFNHWLVRKSAAVAFARGVVRLDRLQPSMVEYRARNVHIGPEDPIEFDGAYPALVDHSRLGIPKVDARFVGSQGRFSRSIQFLELAKLTSPEVLTELEILCLPDAKDPSTNPVSLPEPEPAPLVRQSKNTSLFLFSRFLGRAFLSAWLMLPGRIRMAAYDILRKIGERRYGPSEGDLVQRLPFGLYLKSRGEPEGYRNEYNALRTVHKNTSIPVPVPLDIVASNDGDASLLTTRVPGIPLFRCQEVLSDKDLQQIARDMKCYLAQLRAIPHFPKKRNLDATICNTSGGAIEDTRIRGGRAVGPFSDEAAFSQMLRFPDDPARRGHDIVFTHADLNPRNILVDRFVRPDGTLGWIVTGIVDWEFSGYYPEYWDYTKSMFEGFRWRKRYNDMVHGIFRAFGDYSKEFDIERRSWESGDGV